VKTSKFVLILLTVVGLVLLVCCYRYLNNSFGNENSLIGICPSTPKWFSADDIVGTWVAIDYASGTTDTLVFREDGKYKQTIDFKETSWVDYEIDWNSWRLEFGSKGVPYIYMNEFRICAANSYYDCTWVNDGNTAWSDCCDDRPVKPILGEGVLTVLGPPSYLTPTASLTDISLVLFRGCESSAWSYRFQGY
jgi:hypothetical protein